MTAWLGNLNARERLLVMTAGLLLLFVVGWFLLVRPAINGQTAAENARASAMRDLDAVQSYLKAGGSSGASSKADFNRPALVAAAQRAGLSISRVQPDSGGGLRVWFEDVPAMSVYACLNELTSGYNVRVTSAQITRRSSGAVSAQILLTPA